MIPLCVHSSYSLMWGVPSVQELVQDARDKGYERIALTDTDNLYGLWPFLRACKEAGITPIIGAEVTGGAPDTTARNKGAVCLVESGTGYANLCRLLTQRHMDPGFNLEEAVVRLGKGLTVLTRDPGLLGAWSRAGLNVGAVIHYKPATGVRAVEQLAGELGIPVVASPNSFFMDQSHVHIHRVLRAIDMNTTVCRLGDRDQAPPDAWLAPPQEYRRRFQTLPRAIQATRTIGDRCTFTGPPRKVILPPWDRTVTARELDRGAETAGDHTPAPDPGRALREVAYRGAAARYLPGLTRPPNGEDHTLNQLARLLPGPVVERLEKELAIIAAKGFSSYFLVVHDIIRLSPRICGRGSGAASLVAYSMGITNVCPIKHNLYFERFLNPDRLDPPDIDVDFAWDERDPVIESVLAQYGGHGAMVCNHVTFGPALAIRETAKVFGLGDGEINRVLGHLTRIRGLKKSLPGPDPAPGVPATGYPPRPGPETEELPEPWPSIFRAARHLVNKPRTLSVHPGGVVITPTPINSVAPIQTTPKGIPVIQWEKGGAEEGGMIKIDLLGNRSLAVIRDAIANMAANRIHLDEPHWIPEEDPATMEAIARGHTMGCFYIESPAMRLLQKKTGAGDYHHLVIHSSIIRPAANNYIREYIRRMRGGEWEPIHPLLTGVLDDTYGLMVYQEDVSKTAVAAGGFSHGEADALRKILSKKDREQELADFRARFFTGAAARGMGRKKIEEVWSMIMSFDGYSFCKPHSASYAQVSFQAAWLKVHYPAEFMGAVLSNQGGFYSPFAYVSEARRMGLTILPPDVNLSGRRWYGRGHELRAGFMAVRGLREHTVDRIMEQRALAPFQSGQDFLHRVNPDQGEARALIHGGALDSVCPAGTNRDHLLWTLANHKPGTPGFRILGRGRRDRGKSDHPPPPPSPTRATTPGGAPFSQCLLPLPAPPPPPVPPATGLDVLRQEFRALGFLCGCHPMELYNPYLNTLQPPVVKAAQIHLHRGREIRTAGWLLTGKQIRTKGGNPMEFLTFEDETGTMEATLFPPVYRQYCTTLTGNRPFLLTGLVEEDFGAFTITVHRVEPLRKRCAGGKEHQRAG